MRIEQLQYLAAVTQHGSLRRASERMHVSQPALSEAVSKLERELGVSLLDRHRSGARISRRGRELLAHMDEVLDAVERLKVAAGTEHAGVRHVRMGTVTAATSSLLTPALARMQSRTPATTVELVTLTHAEVEEGVRDGSLDLGLVNVLEGDDAPADLASTALVQGRPVVVLPADHPWAAGSEVDVAQLRGAPFVMMRHGYLMHRYAHRLFGSRPPALVHSTDGAEMAMALVADGIGLTVLPDYSVADDPRVRLGVLTTRPITGETVRVRLEVRSAQHARAGSAAREMRSVLVAGARAHARENAARAAMPAPTRIVAGSVV